MVFNAAHVQTQQEQQIFTLASEIIARQKLKRTQFLMLMTNSSLFGEDINVWYENDENSIYTKKKTMQLEYTSATTTN